MELPSSADVRLSRANVDDVPAICAIGASASSQLRWGGSGPYKPDQLLERWSGGAPSASLTRLAVKSDVIAGYCEVWDDPKAYACAGVAMDRATAEALLNWALGMARSADVPLRAGVLAGSAAERGLIGAGFVAKQRNLGLLLASPPPPLAAPAGLLFESPKPAAIDEIMAVWQVAWPEEDRGDPARARVKFSDLSPDLFFVAVDGASARIVGYMIASLDDAEGYIDEVAVVPAARRGGVGTALMIEALMRLRQRGAESIRLHVRATNPARRIYERLGFVAYEEMVTYIKHA